MKILKGCLNWRVIVALAIVGVGLVVLLPSLALRALPLLALAVCPLSMVVMMVMMREHGERGATRGS